VSQGPCEGYACPPEHSVPSQTVIVHPTGPAQLATSGGESDPMLAIAAAAAVFIGAIAAKRRAKTIGGTR
jgi:hypothetical protein